MDVLTSDYRTIRLSREVYEKSEILRAFRDDFGIDNPVPLPNVDSRIMNLIIHYSLIDMNITEDRQTLFDIAKAADFLHMQELLDKVCKEIADLLKGKSPKEIRSILNISSNNITG